MRKRNVVKKVLITAVALIILLGGVFYFGLQAKLKEFSDEISNIAVNDINLSNINDGVYEGEYQVNELVGAIVEVTVKDHKIINVNFLKHKYGMGGKAEVITEKVIEKQSLEVDAISGATGSSVIILKAIEDALNSK
ncbi:FMN-binding protein [Alkaliphilus hydrothermalis]|uniref:Uncharacterized protein with FMN-binding domain n=1 Tax=Alkaliphilus hydrothermalis TaxID=1482730 RepID=A0ABS2NMS0_9FIRM|nr:FMN-binding protein [Alkaliphilus hydrothermalis]MBM7614202.1 uncharacterized protein with FMN-binding domain [Alkaliphilus hydrothermalis]